MGYQKFGDFTGALRNQSLVTYRNIRSDNIQAGQIVITGGTDGFIQSSNYVPGVSGWSLFGDGSAYLYDVVLLSDLYSSNWDGDIPAALSAMDSGATTGFYFDSSLGSAQLMGNIWVGGDLTLSGSFALSGSGTFSTGSLTESRIEMSALSGTSPSTTIDHYGYYISSTEHFLEDTTSWVSFDLSRTWTFAPDETGTYYFKVSRGIGPSMTASLYSENDSLLGLIGGGGSTTFSVDDQGNYNAASHKFRTSATTRLTVGTTAITAALPILLPSGTLTTLSLRFTSDTDTGLYLYGTNRLAFVGGATVQFSTGNAGSPGIRLISGTATLPSLNFGADSNTGFFWSGTQGMTSYSANGADAFSFWAGGIDFSWTGGTQYIDKSAGTSLAIRNLVANYDVYIQTNDGDSNRTRFFIDGSADIIRLYDHSGVEQIRTESITDGNAIVFSPAAGTSIWATRSGTTDTIGLTGNDYVKLRVSTTDELTLSATGCLIPNTRADFAGGSAVYSDSTTGHLHVNTSARRTKTAITDAPELADVTLSPVRYRKKNSEVFQYGFIADDISAQIKEAGIYDQEGEIDDFSDRAVMAVLAAKVARLEDRVAELLS